MGPAPSSGTRRRGRHDRRNRHRNEAPWPPLEQQQFHGQQDRRHRRRKNRRHPAGGAGNQQLLRSAAERLKNCANNEPKAPPVMMIGPSAPNGPPVPMEIAEESGFSTATFSDIRLPPIKIDSNASGMPWPRIASEPYRAISPTTSPPIAGTRITQAPRWLAAGETNRAENRW